MPKAGKMTGKRATRAENEPKKRRPPVKASLKAEILQIIRPHYRHLCGAYRGPYTVASRHSSWEEIWKSVKNLPNLRKSLPDVNSLRRRFSDWKGQVKQKITAQNATGSCPETFDQSEKLIWDF